jgi:hypothetical protein
MGILDEIYKQQLNKEKKSLQGRENYEKRVHNHAEQVKYKDQNMNPDVPVSVVALRNKYYQYLENYTRRRHMFNIRMNKRSRALWIRVEKAQAESGKTQDEFLKAQFEWFHKKLGTYPKVEQLATQNAVERTKSSSGDTSVKEVSNDIPHNASKVEILKQSEKLLQKMMKAQKCSREEFYKNFVLTGLYTFPEEFLNADPVWKKVKKNYG